MNSLNRFFLRVRDVWFQLLYLGVSEQLSFFEQQKSHLLNVLMVPAVPITTVYVVLNMAARPGLALCNLVTVVCCVLTLFINHSRRFLRCRIPLVIIIIAAFWTEAVFYDNGVEYNLLLMVVCCLVMFDKRAFSFLMSLLIVSTFMYIKYYQYKHYHPQNSMVLRAMLNIASCMVLFVLAIHYFRNIYLRYHQEVQENKKLLELQQQQLLQQKIELEAKNNQLTVLSESRQQILFTLAHDLRNPLSGIEALSKRITEHDILQPDTRKLLTVIESTAGRSQQQIQDLLDMHHYTDIETQGNKRVTNVGELVQQTILPLEYKAAQKAVSIHCELASAVISAFINPMQYSRMLENLVTNAIKFSYSGSAITIALYREADHVLLRVQDQGVGIEEAEIPFLFNRDNKPGRTGTLGEQSFGRGLAICKQIAEAHGGTIWAAKGIPAGSVFTVTIPSGNEV